jgi:hypothetical protein
MSDGEMVGVSGRRIRALHELASDVAPTRNLWPGIAAAIDAECAANAAANTDTHRGLWRMGMGLAASVALIAVGMFVGRMLPGDHAGAMAGMPSPAVNAALLPAIAPDGRHAATRERLLRDADAKLAELPVQDRERVAASLAAIRRSVQEIEAALGREPANALLQELLVNAYQDEMRVLTVLSAARQEI